MTLEDKMRKSMLRLHEAGELNPRSAGRVAVLTTLRHFRRRPRAKPEEGGLTDAEVCEGKALGRRILNEFSAA